MSERFAFKPVPGDDDPAITVWTELRVPHGEELDSTRWAQSFQPLVQAPDHEESVWARVQERPDTILLVTLWRTTSALREFTASPSAQLYRESLAAREIVPLGSREFESPSSTWFGTMGLSLVQLFWVFLPIPLAQEKRDQISQLRGLRPRAFGPGVPRAQVPQTRLPMQLWARETESVQGREVQLMLWPHFWRNAEKARFRDSETLVREDGVVVGRRTVMEDFSARLEEVAGPVEWREEYCDFKRIGEMRITVSN